LPSQSLSTDEWNFFQSNISVVKETTMPRNLVVDEFMTSLNHPYKAEIEKLREIILGANSKIEEDIRWKCSTFVYNGNIASI